MANPIKFEVLSAVGASNIREIARAKVPGGWLIVVKDYAGSNSDPGNAITFMPDPTHSWKGESL